MMFCQNQSRTLGFVFAVLLCIGSLGGSLALLEIAAAAGVPIAAPVTATVSDTGPERFA